MKTRKEYDVDLVKIHLRLLCRYLFVRDNMLSLCARLHIYEHLY